MTINDLTDPKHLISGNQLCASTEGNSTSDIQIVISSIGYFLRYRDSHQNGKLLTDITRARKSGNTSPTCSTRNVSRVTILRQLKREPLGTHRQLLPA